MAFLTRDREQQRETEQQIVNRVLAGLKAERSTFEPDWRDLADHFKPRRARWMTSDRNKGSRRSNKIIDSTPAFAVRTLGAGMMSGMTSPARPWMRLTTGDMALDELDAVKHWLEDVRNLIATTLIRSNFYSQMSVFYPDLGIFGTAAMAVEEDPETVIRCTTFPVGEYFLATNSRHQVRVFAREFEWTVRQVIERFGVWQQGKLSDENLSNTTVRAWQTGQLEQPVRVTHLITENWEADPNRIQAKYKPFRSLYVELGQGDKKVLEDGGYDEFPVLAGRWEASPGDVYGTDSPGWMAISDTKALQFGERLGAQAVEKAVKPPMVAPISMMNSPASILPGAMNYVQETPGSTMRPAIDTSQVRLDWLQNMQDRTSARIDRAFFVDLFQMISTLEKSGITATEIRVRQEEKLLMLGPVLERMNDDVLDPLIDRVFGILLRRGEIPEPPEELQGVPLRVEYISIMAQAQKAVGRAGLETFASMGVNLVQIRPDIMDKYDLDQIVDLYAEMTGVPPSAVVSDERVAEIRTARAQAQAQQAATEEAVKESEAVKNLAQAPAGGETALSRLLSAAAAAGQGGQF